MAIFLFKPALHDWCNKGHDMYCPVGGMVHINDPLPLIESVVHEVRSGSSRFPLSSEWSLTIYPTPYNFINKNVLCMSLIKHFK